MRNDVLFKYSAFLNSLVALQFHSKIGEQAFFSALKRIAKFRGENFEVECWIRNTSGL